VINAEVLRAILYACNSSSFSRDQNVTKLTKIGKNLTDRDCHFSINFYGAQLLPETKPGVSDGDWNLA